MEIETILSALDTQKISYNSSKELEKYIGPEDKTTLAILDKLLTLPHKPSFLLKTSTLLLLENVDLKKALSFMISVFENCSFSERIRFLNEIVKSKYYLLRLAVPFLIRLFWFNNIDFDDLFDRVYKNEPKYSDFELKPACELKEIVKILMKDKIEFVVKTTVLCLTENLLNILNKEEIEECILKIQSDSFNLQPLVVNLSLLLKKDDFSLENWKIRINYAKLCYLFDKPRISLLSKDESEEVRLGLANNLLKLEYNQELIQTFIKDTNPLIKSKAVEYLCLTDKEIPHDIINECWEVKLTFLQNTKSLRNLDLIINTINSLKNHSIWRVRKTVLLACKKILSENTQFLESDFFIKIKEILLNFLFDRISEIRNLVKEQILDFNLEDSFIKKVLMSNNYKHRKVLIKYCVHRNIIYAMKEFSKDILEIKRELIEEISKVKVNEEVYSILQEMMNCEDEEIKSKIGEIID